MLVFDVKEFNIKVKYNNGVSMAANYRHGESWIGRGRNASSAGGRKNSSY